MIIVATAASIAVLLAALIVLAVVAPVDAKVVITYGSSIAGVAMSGGAFTLYRLRRAKKARDKKTESADSDDAVDEQ